MARQRPTAAKSQIQETLDDQFDMDLLEEQFANDDTTAVGHLILAQQRRLLYYMRLIEHDMPKLAGKSSLEVVENV